MKQLLMFTRILCVIVALCISGLGQAGKENFDWNWRGSEELSWKQSINRNKNLSAAERNRLLDVISGQLRPSMTDLDIKSHTELRTVAGATRIKYVDLNGDGRSEVIAQAGGENFGCSPTGNCPLWILRWHDGKYGALLNSEAQTFTIQTNKSEHFMDVVLTRHSSAFESEVKVYKFDGEFYRENGCYIAQWQKLGDDGEYHEIKEPLIAECGLT